MSEDAAETSRDMPYADDEAIKPPDFDKLFKEGSNRRSRDLGAPTRMSHRLSIPQSHSEPNSENSSPKVPVRSSSFKKPRHKQVDEVAGLDKRQRTGSLPIMPDFPGTNEQQIPPLILDTLSPNLGGVGANVPETPHDCYRVREFHLTPKGGIKHRADSFRRKSRSNISMSSAPGNCPNGGIQNDRRESNVSCSASGGMLEKTDTVSSEEPEGAAAAVPETRGRGDNTDKVYTVLMLGAHRVGRTALTRQFTTSDHVDTFDNSQEEARHETIVSVNLDGVESELHFLTPPEEQLSEDGPFDDFGNIDAYIFIYSVSDKKSFQKANEWLSLLREEGRTKCTVILVANKCDLVRSRVIRTVDGKLSATDYHSKYTETSAVWKHQVDELLVGTLAQIRMRETERTTGKSKKIKPKSKTFVHRAAKGLMHKLFKKKADAKKISKTCDDLSVLD